MGQLTAYSSILFVSLDSLRFSDVVRGNKRVAINGFLPRPHFKVKESNR